MNIVVLLGLLSLLDLADIVRIHKCLMFIYQEISLLNIRRQRGKGLEEFAQQETCV